MTPTTPTSADPKPAPLDTAPGPAEPEVTLVEVTRTGHGALPRTILAVRTSELSGVTAALADPGTRVNHLPTDALPQLTALAARDLAAAPARTVYIVGTCAGDQWITWYPPGPPPPVPPRPQPQLPALRGRNRSDGTRTHPAPPGRNAPMTGHERRITAIAVDRATPEPSIQHAAGKSEAHWPCPGCGTGLCMQADTMPDPAPYCRRCADNLATVLVTAHPEPPTFTHQARGVRLDWVGEDSDMIAHGHIHPLVFTAAAEQVNRTAAGIHDLQPPIALSHQWAIRLPKQPPNAPWCQWTGECCGVLHDPDPDPDTWYLRVDGITADTPGAFPITYGAW